MKKEKSPFFKFLVAHINDSWIKMKGFPYPFQGKDFQYLKNYCHHFKEWGLMSLWDKYIECDNEWVKTRSGYSLGAFFNCLPWLVDVTGWKEKAKEYEKKLNPEIPENVLALFDMAKLKVLNSREVKR